MQDCVFADRFESVLDNDPSSPAIVTDDRELSYGQLDEKSDELASALLDHDIGHGDRVATILPNSIEYIITTVATMKLGIGLVPLSTQFRSQELEYMISKVDADAVIAIDTCDGGDFHQILGEITNSLDSVKLEVFCGVVPEFADTSFASLLETGQEATEPIVVDDRREEDENLVLFTSGTTGNPKPVPLSSKNVVTTCHGHISRWDLSADDVGLTASPNNHVGGATVMIGTCLLAGATIRPFTEFDPTRILTAIDEDGGSYFNGVPVMFSDIVNHDRLSYFDVSDFRLGIIGGQAPSPELVTKASENLGGRIVQGWGMTETAGFATSTYPDDPPEIHANTIGLPMPGCERKVVSVQDSTVEVDQGESGELLVRGDSIFEGYLDMPDATADSFTKGWFETGDIIRQRKDGYIEFLDRMSNMFISGGENIYPREIENYIEAHQMVDQACVVNVPDDRWGEVGWCYIKPFGDIDEEQLEAYCRENFANYKIPKKFIVRDELPLSPANKISRSELKEEALEQLEGS